MADVVGAASAVVYLLMMVGIFAARLAGLDGWDRWFGGVALTIVIPMVFLLWRGVKDNRPFRYFVWIGSVLLFQAVEFTLDYALQLDFRQTTAIVIPYVVLFFAALGGLLGLASQAGRAWVWITGPMFVVVAVLAFVSRSQTGL